MGGLFRDGNLRSSIVYLISCWGGNNYGWGGNRIKKIIFF